MQIATAFAGREEASEWQTRTASEAERGGVSLVACQLRSNFGRAFAHCLRSGKGGDSSTVSQTQSNFGMAGYRLGQQKT
ncbi:MAG: hypothetical protein LUG99_17110 [Lachnospiraceae bacterium]|nr:hypothetical protein [Lachnospiraceae bacterium]